VDLSIKPDLLKIDDFEFRYFEITNTLENLLRKNIVNFEQQLRDMETIIPDADKKIKSLETPSYILLKELRSIYDFLF
jgi:hypothetical protein